MNSPRDEREFMRWTFLVCGGRRRTLGGRLVIAGKRPRRHRRHHRGLSADAQPDGVVDRMALTCIDVGRGGEFDGTFGADQRGRSGAESIFLDISDHPLTPVRRVTYVHCAARIFSGSSQLALFLRACLIFPRHIPHTLLERFV